MLIVVIFQKQFNMSDNNDSDDLPDGMNGNKRHSHFHVFTNPLEMERFFNQQMDEIMKSFGMFGFGGKKTGDQGEFSAFPAFPAIDTPGSFQGGGEGSGGEERGSRDFMLKKDHEKSEKLTRPGYIDPNVYEFESDKYGRGMQSDKKDTDLDDGGVNTEELGELFKKPHNHLPNESRANPFFNGWPNKSDSLFGGIFGNSFPFSDHLPQQQVKFVLRGMIPHTLRIKNIFAPMPP